MTRDEAIAAAVEKLGAPAAEVTVEHCKGHDGTGWYAWYSELPSEGSVRVDVKRAARKRGER
jgi:hypothetical protein